MKQFVKQAFIATSMFFVALNATANDKIINDQQIKQAIDDTLLIAMNELATHDFAVKLAEDLTKSGLELETNQLVAQATAELPTNRFTVVIAD